MILNEDGSQGEIPLAGGQIIVAAPEAFYQGSYDSFDISWIDFYR